MIKDIKNKCYCAGVMEKSYPNCMVKNLALFEEVLNYGILIDSLETQLGIPIEELYEFLSKAEKNLLLIEEKEVEYGNRK